ncbi:MAG: ABC transporter ATP-binding protein [Candidatus Bathyarchaeota archaeon]|nr:ABC transporter ATP-binding protein [Candidatus Bathyarchaeum tardum]WGM89213.1 MAG: ABC transporter ATP-binding protein [Candidatus Bathyarchaeum tardum]
MQVYAAGLIDKTLRSINAKLQKKLVSECKKALHVSGKAMSSQELNAFIVLSGQKDGTVDQKVVDFVETGRVYWQFKKYYADNESRLRQHLKDDQELRETSKIVKDFIREIDPNLVKIFDSHLKKIIKELPSTHREIQLKSYVTAWDFAETQEYRFYLSGFDDPTFTGSTTQTQLNVEELVDKLIIANFFAVFMKPTIIRLKELDSILERLELGVSGSHYKTKNPKLQKKLELFLRILAAKLSALQDIDNLLSRIFNLFQVPQKSLIPHKINNESIEFSIALKELASEIEQGKTLLREVHNKVQQCQIHLRDYLDEHKNGIRTVESNDQFKNALLPLAELSTDLFVEAELLKMWSDFFGVDLPYFTFNKQVFNTQNVEVTDLHTDNIIAVRGLTKNYNLGQTTVYALRGVNLDIKEGEFVAIVGNSGAGKTTLLNCIAGLDSPDYGVVLFRGENLHQMGDESKSKARLKEMGFIFQSYALLPHFSARENIALPADLAGLSKDLKDRIENLLEGVGLSNQAEQYPATLSGGQMQRVAIARALTNRPAVIFADEPTGDLDSVTGKQVMDLLKKFHEETKTTIIIITHEEDIADYAERQIKIEDGVIAS